MNNPLSSNSLFKIINDFEGVYRSAMQRDRNVENLQRYKDRKFQHQQIKLAEAEKIIRERMDGAPLYKVDEAIAKASIVLLHEDSTPMNAAILAIGDWPEDV